jgi:hypothetical protein
MRTQTKPMFLEFDIPNAKSIPYIRDRERLIEQYAMRYFERFEGAETVGDFCRQASLDIGDKSIAVDLAIRIRRLEREQRRIAA